MFDKVKNMLEVLHANYGSMFITPSGTKVHSTTSADMFVIEDAQGKHNMRWTDAIDYLVHIDGLK